MPVKIKNDLTALNLLSFFLLLCIWVLPDNPLRIVLGIPFVFFLPGYSLIAALYPRKSGISGTERIVWSVGLSVAIISLTGLCLNLFPPGISLIPAAVSMTSFIFFMSVLTWYRRRSLAEYERFSVFINLNSLLKWRDKTTLDKILFAGLVLSVLCAVGVIGYKIITPVPEERITEFYVLDVEGNAAGYPDGLKIGEEGKVIVGITNSEHDEMTYRLEVKVDGILHSMIEEISLKNGETKQMDITFSFSHAGNDRKVEFELYRTGETSPLVTPLYLWIDVIE
jgi:uncharacterized membrane protein